MNQILHNSSPNLSALQAWTSKPDSWDNRQGRLVKCEHLLKTTDTQSRRLLRKLYCQLQTMVLDYWTISSQTKLQGQVRRRHDGVSWHASSFFPVGDGELALERRRGNPSLLCLRRSWCSMRRKQRDSKGTYIYLRPCVHMIPLTHNHSLLVISIARSGKIDRDHESNFDIGDDSAAAAAGSRGTRRVASAEWVITRQVPCQLSGRAWDNLQKFLVQNTKQKTNVQYRWSTFVADLASNDSSNNDNNDERQNKTYPPFITVGNGANTRFLCLLLSVWYFCSALLKKQNQFYCHLRSFNISFDALSVLLYYVDHIALLVHNRT